MKACSKFQGEMALQVLQPIYFQFAILTEIDLQLKFDLFCRLLQILMIAFNAAAKLIPKGSTC